MVLSAGGSSGMRWRSRRSQVCLVFAAVSACRGLISGPPPRGNRDGTSSGTVEPLRHPRLRVPTTSSAHGRSGGAPGRVRAPRLCSPAIRRWSTGDPSSKGFLGAAVAERTPECHVCRRRVKLTLCRGTHASQEGQFSAVVDNVVLSDAITARFAWSEDRRCPAPTGRCPLLTSPMCTICAHQNPVRAGMIAHAAGT
jgi:hypothetical protein